MFHTVTFQALTFLIPWQMPFKQQTIMNLHTKNHLQKIRNLVIDNSGVEI